MSTVANRTRAFAVDAAAVVAFLEHHETRELSGTPRRHRRLINGCPLDQDIDARIIRRWRTTFKTTTRESAEGLLAKFDLTLEDLIAWSPTNPIIRGAL